MTLQVVLVNISQINSYGTGFSQAFVVCVNWQSLESNGRVVERAAAWCSSIDLPYYRLNPILLQHVRLSCTDDQTLVNMLFETQNFIYRSKEHISSLVKWLWIVCSVEQATTSHWLSGNFESGFTAKWHTRMTILYMFSYTIIQAWLVFIIWHCRLDCIDWQSELFMR